MQQSEVEKLQRAMKDLVGIEAHLSNFLRRGAPAGKIWTETTLHTYVKGRPGTNGGAGIAPQPQKAATLKSALGVLKQLLSDAKVVVKDVDKAQKIASDQKTLAKYQTAKEFRDKVLTKQFASLRTFEQNSHQFLLPLLNLIPGKGVYPGMSEVETKVTVNSLEEYVIAYNKLRIALNTL